MYHFEFIRGVTLKVATKYCDREKIHGYSWVINPTIQTKPISLNFFISIQSNSNQFEHIIISLGIRFKISNLNQSGSNQIYIIKFYYFLNVKVTYIFMSFVHLISTHTQ